MRNTDLPERWKLKLQEYLIAKGSTRSDRLITSKFGGGPNSGDEENSTKLKLLQKCLQLLAVAVNSEATFAA